MVGQYIYLKINQISFIEYHPFTLTSAPEDDFYMVNMRQIGDWTSKDGLETRFTVFF